MKITKSLLILVILLILGIILYYFYGNIISLFFILVIFSCFGYYNLMLNAESNINSDKFKSQALKKISPSDNVNNTLNFKIFQSNSYQRYRVFYLSLFFILIYCFSIFALKFYLLPPENKPYFNNTDYSAIMNTGIGFENKLNLYSNSQDPTINGVYYNQNGTFEINSKSENRYSLSFENFYKPVFLKENNKQKIANNIFKNKLENNFKITNNRYSLSFFEFEKNKNLFSSNIKYKFKVKIDININDSLENTKYTDTLLVESFSLNKGISFYDLIVLNKNTKTLDVETRRKLEEISLQLGNSYFLVNNENEDPYITFFPDTYFFENHYTFSINNSIQNPELKNNTDISEDEIFYVGLENSNEKMSISRAKNDNYTNILNFNSYNYFSLSSSMRKPELGFKQTRFLCNHYSQILNHNLREGFLFHENLRNANCNSIISNLEYTTHKPGKPISAYISDAYNSKNNKAIDYENFSISSKNKEYQWIFNLRDFSKNGFSFNKLFFLLSALFLAMILILIYSHSKDLMRIEPIIFYIIYALVFFRCILFWRVATFPPTFNINAHEFDTLQNFDYNLMGISLPIPFTFILIFSFLIFLFLFRKYKKKNIPPFIKTKTDALYILLSKYKINKFIDKNIFESYIYLVSGMFILFICKALNIEILIRIFSLVYPIIIYFSFAKKFYDLQDEQEWVWNKNKFVNFIERFVFYLQQKKVFYLTLGVFLYLCITDRGFAVIFLLYIIFKSIIFNFLSKAFNNNWKEMLLSPKNNWIYAIISFIVYLIFLVYKPMFYYLLINKIWIISAILLLYLIFLYLKTKKYNSSKFIITFVIFLITIIPFTHQKLDDSIDNHLRHVIYRASILFQPIEEMIYKNKANSFEEKKIYETAESQWFINCYLNKKYDEALRINLRPHFKGGVNFSTQTRDVILPRFVISEHGKFTMYLILLLTLIPFIIYFLSYKITDEKQKILSNNAISGMALILFFSIGFFVWLTSTNRFVFFGQDFPFLSLTSRVSILISLVIFSFVLISKPEERQVDKINTKVFAVRYLMLFISIISMVLISGKSNELNDEYFNVNLSTTENTINTELNEILYNIQTNNNYNLNSSLVSKTNLNKELPPHLSQILDILIKSDEYKALYNNSNTYTKSVLDILKNNPAFAFKQSSPIYLRYDNNKYEAQYNNHLHLELPAYDDKLVWKGDIVQEKNMYNNIEIPSLQFNDKIIEPQKLPYKFSYENFECTIIPNTWMPDGMGSIALLNTKNTMKKNEIYTQIYNSKNNNAIKQDLKGYVLPLHYNDIAYFKENNKNYFVTISENKNKKFAANYWINGKQRIMYPLGNRFFWMYNFAHAMKDINTQKNAFNKDVNITLDYELNDNIQNYIFENIKIISKADLDLNFQ